MLALKFFIKLLPYVWPFVREMVLGKKTIMEAIREHKKKVAFLMLIVFSFGTNFFTVTRLVTMSVDHLALDKKYKELESKYKEVLSSPRHTIANGAEVQAPVKQPEVIPDSTEPVPKVDRHHKPKVTANTTRRGSYAEQLRMDLDKIKQREESEH